jgi:hypothetical protein
MRATVGVFVRMVVVRRVFHACSITPRSRPAQQVICTRVASFGLLAHPRDAYPGAGSLVLEKS